jgi:hypothetical protein
MIAGTIISYNRSEHGKAAGLRKPRYLIRDRDSVSGEVFIRRLRAMGIRQFVAICTEPGNPRLLRTAWWS